MLNRKFVRGCAALALVMGAFAPVVHADSALVADAGASSVATNGHVALLGSGWGGTPPYRFAWSVEGAQVTNAQQATARLGVADWDPGVYTARLTVVDAGGARASDTVKFVVGELDDALRLAVDAGGTYTAAPGEAVRLDGAVRGGQAPYQVGWDLDRDGRIDVDGASVEVTLEEGHHLVRLLATDANGMEAQQMTSVYVSGKDHLADLAVPLTIIGISDSGINPYHSEFSAETYPDPRVLELTNNFTRHPCEYITNYPCTSRAIPITRNGEYYPEQDKALFHIDPANGAIPMVEPGLLHWIPGTKIIGALTFGGYDAPPADYILDNNGHGTGSAGVALGNRYGYCPSCLFYIVDSLDEDEVFGQPFAEITSHSHGYVGNAPLGVLALDALFDPHPSKAAVERGVSVLFSAGNGVGNAFAVTNETYGSDQNGPAWTVIVGAMRRDTRAAIVGEGTPAYISSWGDGYLPSACRSGVHGICAHSGTSAASPYTAGVFGSVLRGVREALGDYTTGVREGQVIASGRPIPDSPYLADGQLTRRELRAAVLKTAAPLDDEFNAGFPYPAHSPFGEGDDVFLGYGAATPNSAARALAVLLGEMPMPDRSSTDEFFAQDCETRDQLYGSYDRDGDGEVDGCDKDIAADPAFAGTGGLSTEPPFVPFTAADVPGRMPVLTEALTYELHRVPAHEPYRTAEPCGLPQTANEEDHQQFMSRRADIEGDLEPCFDSRITSTVAGFRPKGIFHADDELQGILPAGSQVDVTVYVQTAAPGAITLRPVLTASDRVIGEVDAGTVVATAPTLWSEATFSFTTDRVATAGEVLGLHFTLSGQVEWAYGFEGDHASRVTITPAAGDAAPFGATIDAVAAVADGTEVSGRVAVPDLGPDTELGGAGFAPVTVNVQVSADPDFASAVYGQLDARTGTYSAVLPEAAGTVYARALRNQVPSEAVSAEVASARSSARALTPVKGGALGGVLLVLLAGLGLRRRMR